MIKGITFGLCLIVLGSMAAADYGPAQRESIEWCDIWLPHANETDARLPRVLLIGDSITRGYYPAVERRLAGKALVGRLTTSAFVSDPMLLQEIALVLDAQTFDVIQFNNGMHGWHHSEAEYRAALPQLVAAIRQHAPGAKLIWANTTPLKDGAGAGAGEPTTADKNVESRKLMLQADLTGRSNARVAERNAIALAVVQPLGIPVVDLNSAMQGHPEFYQGDVHFNERGIAVQAEQVAAKIESVLPSTTGNAVPVAGPTFENGALIDHVLWRDTNGEIINAHDGGILQVDGVYHWYGLALRPRPAVAGPDGGQKTTVGVVMYRSTDLHTWTYEGVVLESSQDPRNPLYGPMRFERPKIVYNDRTRQYVMWFHFVNYPGDHGNGPGQGEAGVASCATINGKYTFHRLMRPLGDDGIVRDCTVFKDDDGSAYFIYDRDVRVPGPKFGRVLHIVKLTDDYLGFTDSYVKIENAARREAPVMFKRHGVYYLVTSGMTGWDFNESNYYRADRVLGPYQLMGDPFLGAGRETTFQSQGTYAFQVEGRDDIVLMLERHNTANMVESSYIWLPMHFMSDGRLEIPYQKSWSLAH